MQFDEDCSKAYVTGRSGSNEGYRKLGQLEDNVNFGKRRLIHLLRTAGIAADVS